MTSSRWRPVSGLWPQLGRAPVVRRPSPPSDYVLDDNPNADQRELYADEDEGSNLIGGPESDLAEPEQQIKFAPTDEQMDNNIGQPTRLREISSKPQSTNKAKPISASSKPQLAADKSRPSNANRITMLEEPSELRPNSTQLKLNGPAPSQLGGSAESGARLHYAMGGPNPSDPARDTQRLAQQSADLYLFVVPSISAILLLLGLLLHFVYRRRPGAKPSSSRLRPTALLPSYRSRRGGRRKSSFGCDCDCDGGGDDDDDDKELAELAFLAPTADSSSESAAQKFGCGGERIRLVGRCSAKRSAVPEGEGEAANDGDEIIRLDPVPSEDGGGSKPSSVVILQRRLARSSLVVAAKSAKPKVRLISTRLRKFIDDEASDLRKSEERTQGPHEPFGRRIFAYFSTVIGRRPTGEAEQADQGADRANETNPKQRADQISAQSSTEVMVKTADGNDKTCGSVEAQGPPEKFGPQVEPAVGSLDAPHSMNQKLLSPSPMLNDAGLSSVSACSLFTPSPVEGGAAQMCGCSMDVANQLAVGDLGLEPVRCKSQTHSPACQLEQVAFRPCCSASPSALGAQAAERAAYSYPHPIDYHPFDHKLKSHFGPHQTFDMDRGPRCAPTSGQLKASSHIKRQYENYYEDEQADAYRRLTASIGMVHFEQPQQLADPSALGYPTPSHKLLQFACQQHHQNQAAQPPLMGPYLTHSQVLEPNLQALCKCCQVAPPGGAGVPLVPSSYPERRTLEGGGQLGAFSASQWNTDSASELASSASTSLGGSDSGFISAAPNYSGQTAVCLNPLCSCQRQVLVPPPPPSAALSILVQQPSGATAAPPVHQSPSCLPPLDQQPTECSAAAESCCAEMETKREAELNAARDEWMRSAAQMAQLKSQRARWRNRRRPSHARPADANLRRMSLTGDQTSGASQQAVGLQHRASIATDGGWSQQCGFQRQPELSQLSGRREEAAFFEAQFGETLNSKSNYSSSGGSSSGIGFSGSACTNTPTSAFAHDNLLSRQEPLIDLALMGREHPAFGYLQQRQVAPPTRCMHTNPLTAEGERLHEHLGALSSRKFSLPVQLESQAAERVSPNRSRLLFEKNLQRVDSRSLVQGRPAPGEAALVNLVGYGQVRAPPIDSRRSSQTITRQSSFWLEDNSADSILSLSAGGCPEQQAPNDDDCVFAEGVSLSDVQPPSRAQQELARGERSQRPSLSSIMQSGDSIESVRQKPSSASAHEPTSSQTGNKLAANRSDDAGPSRAAAGKVRLSSSSTSSAASNSSPSPDFSRQSSRLFGLASRSSSITKRHLGGKLRPRGRFGRPSAGSLEKGGSPFSARTQHQNSAPSSSAYPAPPKHQPLDESESDDGDDEGELRDHTGALDTEFAAAPTSIPGGGRTASDLNSASLERQCRELWKLRATLHEDPRVDNWANYHQRLNRRYDSGYKSIENQLSSSLEGNTLAAAAAAANHPTAGTSRPQAEEPVRPQSVCSNTSSQGPRVEKPPTGSSFDEQLQVSPSEERDKDVQHEKTSLESIECKLAEFGFDEASQMADPEGEHNCESRNSSTKSCEERNQRREQ